MRVRRVSRVTRIADVVKHATANRNSLLNEKSVERKGQKEKQRHKKRRAGKNHRKANNDPKTRELRGRSSQGKTNQNVTAQPHVKPRKSHNTTRQDKHKTNPRLALRRHLRWDESCLLNSGMDLF
jgi:hypothetical protein